MNSLCHMFCRPRFCLWLLLLTLILFVVSLVLYINAENEVVRAYSQQLNSFKLAEELRHSSDDLTRMVRTYIVTGEPIYKQHFQEILDIRNGKSPRPKDYNNIYWDLVLADDKRPRATENTVSLLSLMRQIGFTDGEFAKLEQAKANSDELTNTEYAAMALIESTTPSTQANRLQAMAMFYLMITIIKPNTTLCDRLASYFPWLIREHNVIWRLLKCFLTNYFTHL